MVSEEKKQIGLIRINSYFERLISKRKLSFSYLKKINKN
jgi:hypothetical protein